MLAPARHYRSADVGRDERIEQLQREGARLTRPLGCLIEQLPRAHAAPLELVSVLGQPVRDGLGRDLGVKLDPQAAADRVRLWRLGRVRKQLRAGREAEAVEVPDEPRSL